MADGEFKPNMYPIMYWALAYGATAGLVLLLVKLLAGFITWVWFPVFLAGVLWGGWRNYQKQKLAWQQNTGAPAVPQSPMTELRQAVTDISEASRDLLAEQPLEATAPPTEPDEPGQSQNTQSPPPQ
jgi:hypothetical protein